MREIFGSLLKLLLALLFMVIIIYICFQFSYGNEQTITCKVNDKWTKRVSSKDSDLYLVSCDDEVYEISDLTFKGKFNSANLYAGLKKGKKYQIKTTGYRFGFFSSYQNINEYKEIKK